MSFVFYLLSCSMPLTIGTIIIVRMGDFAAAFMVVFMAVISGSFMGMLMNVIVMVFMSMLARVSMRVFVAVLMGVLMFLGFGVARVFSWSFHAQRVQGLSKE
jgi:hypothetical protein